MQLWTEALPKRLFSGSVHAGRCLTVYMERSVLSKQIELTGRSYISEVSPTHKTGKGCCNKKLAYALCSTFRGVNDL